jgi:hypothetical protein
MASSSTTATPSPLPSLTNFPFTITVKFDLYHISVANLFLGILIALFSPILGKSMALIPLLVLLLKY